MKQFIFAVLLAAGLVVVAAVALQSDESNAQADNRSRQGVFTEDDLSITTVLGHYAAVALDNFALYEDVLAAKEQEERIRRIFQKYVPHTC